MRLQYILLCSLILLLVYWEVFENSTKRCFFGLFVAKYFSRLFWDFCIFRFLLNFNYYLSEYAITKLIYSMSLGRKSFKNWQTLNYIHPVEKVNHWSKKLINKIDTWVIRCVSGKESPKNVTHLMFLTSLASFAKKSQSSKTGGTNLRDFRVPAFKNFFEILWEVSRNLFNLKNLKQMSK